MDLMNNRIYYVSPGVIVRDDPRYGCPVLECRANCGEDEIQVALKHCNMEVVTVVQKVRRIFTLRRKGHGEEHDDSSNGSEEGT